MILVLVLAGTVKADDWPTYMHDNARSGVSTEALDLPLAELWTYVPPAEPKPAWPDPQPGMGELPKLTFDDATHVALAGDTVYFGSPVDNGVHALDAATGTRKWSFFTEGPVRLTPTVADGRAYAGSDDGNVYCLDARTGARIWSTRPMPGMTRLLGAGRMMSLWPVRTGVLVDGGVAYCGAGLFPARGTAVCALDAKDGILIWKNSQGPKGYNLALAPNGHLLATPEQIYVPCGRTTPLTFSRADGALRGHMVNSYDIVAGKGLVSGDYGVLVGDLFYLGTQNVLHGYDPAGKHVEYWHDTRQLVATSNRYIRLTGPDPAKGGRGTLAQPNGVSAIDRAAYDTGGRKRPVPKAVVQWSYAGSNLQAIIVAGPHVLVGGVNAVFALDAATGREIWKSKVEGEAKGLAIANGRLVVSTDEGRIHCFGQGKSVMVPAKPAVMPFPAGADGAKVTELAEAIAKDSKIERGYGLVIGGDGARLAFELAKRTGLLVHVLETDQAGADRTRAALSSAGAYGTKVVVDLAPPGGTNGLPYPPYFANVVVIEDLALGQGTVAAREVMRVLKPCGGVLYAGAKTPDSAWARAGAVTKVKIGQAGEWTKLVRGRLAGAGDWTHQYADAGNTGSSDDERVRGKPEVLWYGEPGADKMQERHSRTEAPLSLEGRMFVQGVRQPAKTPLLLSFDAYNGVPYWEREMPGAERLYINGDCGNLACSTQGLFVVTGDKCQRLDLLTGATRATYAAPASANGKKGLWAYMAVEGDTLVGSVSSAYHFSDTVFAYDLGTGRIKWRYDGSVIRNSTLAIQGGRVLFAEHRGQTKAPVVLDLKAWAAKNAAARRRAAAIKAKDDDETDDTLAGGDAPPPAKPVPEPYVRSVVALDLATGKQVWAQDVDLAGCGAWAGSWINGLCLIAKHDVVVLCGIYNAYGRVKGDENKRRATALSAKDGAPLWNRAIGNFVRPVVAGDRIIGRPRAFDLLTGEPVMRTGPKGAPVPWSISSGGACGLMSASEGALFYRLGSTIMMDVNTGTALMSFAGMRPGCLINIIPAGGVIVQVEASSGCICYHALQATVAFVPQGLE